MGVVAGARDYFLVRCCCMMGLVLIVFLPLVMSAACAQAVGVLISPLFGFPGRGDQFDDGATALIPHVARVSTLSICYEELGIVYGIQLSYVLQDNNSYSGPFHGACPTKPGINITEKLLKFKEGEMMVRIQGKVTDEGDIYGVTELTFFTSTEGVLSSYGPFGQCFQCKPFSMTGTVVGVFGRSGLALNAIGVYILNSALPPMLYNKTTLIGGDNKVNFDDFLSDNEQPSKIMSMEINYEFLVTGVEPGARVDFDYVVHGMQVSYSLTSGATSTVQHGDLSTNDKQSTGILNFADDEWITQVDISLGQMLVLNYLRVVTLDSKGSVKTYGPFGSDHENVTSIHGIIRAFYGKSSPDYLDSLGFYV